MPGKYRHKEELIYLELVFQNTELTIWKFPSTRMISRSMKKNMAYIRSMKVLATRGS
jgi:hypothetical protein